MKSCALFAAIILVAVMLPCLAGAEMTSDHYHLTTTVVSGGGGPSASAHFQMKATLGQPSPLIDPIDPPRSYSYDLFTGFWYTQGLALPFSVCPADFEPDGDVDRDDMIFMAGWFGHENAVKDTDNDGDMDGLDLYELVIDYNRDDCMP